MASEFWCTVNWTLKESSTSISGLENILTIGLLLINHPIRSHPNTYYIALSQICVGTLFRFKGLKAD